MQQNEEKIKEVLNVFKKEGILNNVIIIGSWCLFFYKYIFDNFEPTIRTTDIDFYVPDSKSIIERNGLVKSFKEINYDLVHDILTNKTTFISPDGFEIEFLTQLNRNQLTCIKLGNTNIYAESISYVEIFSGNYIQINYDNLDVKVASPASYVLQKLLINDKREEKSDKDIESIKDVMFYINVSRKYKDELIDLYKSFPKRWKQKVNKVIKQIGITIFN